MTEIPEVAGFFFALYPDGTVYYDRSGRPSYQEEVTTGSTDQGFRAYWVNFHVPGNKPSVYEHLEKINTMLKPYSVRLRRSFSHTFSGSKLQKLSWTNTTWSEQGEALLD